ncbi:unnamed protein product [Anisakis simplex]|uniref:Uncharacterized protein n=1 Tax=Anisakis simplex TaxID=6269 RepID=A0A3P6QM05_ANISI|nr:unnamed protein product [Anisakis simplex]
MGITTSCEDEWGPRCVTTRIVQWTSAQVELKCIITPKQQPSRKTTPIIEAWPDEDSIDERPSLQLFPMITDESELGYFSANITCQPYGQWTISSPNSIQIPSGVEDFTYISCAQHVLRAFQLD